MDHEIRDFMGYLWYQNEDGIITIGINEDALDDFSEITSIDLPRENESIESDVVCGTVETDEGPMDLYSPVSGKIVEINAAVLEEPSLIMDDPTGDGWLIRVEAAEDLDDEDEEEDDYDDEDEEDEDEDYEDED